MKLNTPVAKAIMSTLGVVGIWAGVLACTSDLTPAWVENSSTASADPTLPDPTMTTNVLPKDADVTNEPISELPYQVQVYASMARNLVDNGTIPRSRVTRAVIQEDVAREYGITLTDDQAGVVRAEVLR